MTIRWAETRFYPVLWHSAAYCRQFSPTLAPSFVSLSSGVVHRCESVPLCWRTARRRQQPVKIKTSLWGYGRLIIVVRCVRPFEAYFVLPWTRLRLFEGGLLTRDPACLIILIGLTCKAIGLGALFRDKRVWIYCFILFMNLCHRELVLKIADQQCSHSKRLKEFLEENGSEVQLTPDDRLENTPQKTNSLT